jgi:hypothetical protein
MSHPNRRRDCISLADDLLGWERLVQVFPSRRLATILRLRHMRVGAPVPGAEGPVMAEVDVRACRLEAAHKPHFWGSAEGDGTPYRCMGVAEVFFYRDWERQVRRFHPPGPDQIQAARRLLDALDRWEDMPDTAGSRWAVKFLRWLAEYETPSSQDRDP